MGFQCSVNMIVDPLTDPLSQEVFGKHVKAMGLRILNDRFGQVGDVGIMCPATIFKLLGITNIRNTSLWNYTCIYAWNYFT